MPTRTRVLGAKLLQASPMAAAQHAMAATQLTGRVLLVPRTRDGWGAVVEDHIPALIGRLIRQPAPYEDFYEVDSPYLLFHYEQVTKKLGWRWHWPVSDIAKGTTHELAEGAECPQAR